MMLIFLGYSYVGAFPTKLHGYRTIPFNKLLFASTVSYSINSGFPLTMDYVILIPNNGISTIEVTVGGSNGYYYTKVRTRRSICVVVLSCFDTIVCGDVCKK